MTFETELLHRFSSSIRKLKDVHVINRDGIDYVPQFGLRDPGNFDMYCGVSFFSDYTGPFHMSGISIPDCHVVGKNILLPDGLALQHDTDSGVHPDCIQKYSFGQLYTIYPTKELTYEYFENQVRLLLTVIGTDHGPNEVILNKYQWPGQRHSMQASAALLKYSRTAPDANDRVASLIFHDYIGITNMPFSKLLRHGPLATLTALAMEAFVSHRFVEVYFADNVRHALCKALGIEMKFELSDGEEKEDSDNEHVATTR